MFNGYFTPAAVLMTSAISLGGAAVALYRGFRPVDAWIDRWAAAHGLRLTAETTPTVARRLQLGRRIRTLGFVAGWLVPYVVFWIQRDMREPSLPGLGFAFVGGYLIAAVFAELWLSRPPDASGIASLEPRTIRAYVPRWAYLLPRVAVAVAVAMLIAYATLPWRDGAFGPTVAAYARSVLLVCIWVALIEATQRLIVRRRQSFDSPAMIQADDALRSSSVGILAGVSIASAAGLCTTLLWNLGARTDVQIIRWLAFPVTLALLMFGLAAFVTLSNPMLQWRVRRQVRVGHPA